MTQIPSPTGSPRFVQPPLETHSQLREPMTEGEKLIFDLFNQHLDIKWEIYFRPHMNGLRPDFVLLNPQNGIAVFEVVEADTTASRPLWKRKYGEDFSQQLLDAHTRLEFYRDQIYSLYCPRLARKKGFSVIAAGMITPFEEKEVAQALQSEKQRKFAKYWPVSGATEVRDGNINAVFPHHKNRFSYMTHVIAEDLRGWLVEPDFASEQRLSLQLDSKQKELVETRTRTGFRRIKGPAGSGKSLVLAARAARLADEGKSVLIVTFNITLMSYLRDLMLRAITRPGSTENVVFLHFHWWCKIVCYQSGYSESYRKLFENINLAKSKTSIEKILDVELPSLVYSINTTSRSPRYDAILVDEGQDFLPLWWHTLKRYLAPDGEMVLVADTTQDIYGKADSWTDMAITDAGFSGSWARLETGYRTPLEARQEAARFALSYLPLAKIDLPVPAQGELDFRPCTLRWVQCSSEDSLKNCADAILAMMRQTGKNGMANADITFICNNNKFGKEVITRLDGYGVKSIDTFDPDYDEQQRQKLAFFMGKAKVKATTLHSFKGWETRLLVVYIDPVFGDESHAAIYAALTRIKRSNEGSYLTVICSDPDLAEYGKAWN